MIDIKTIEWKMYGTSLIITIQSMALGPAAFRYTAILPLIDVVSTRERDGEQHRKDQVASLPVEQCVSFLPSGQVKLRAAAVHALLACCKAHLIHRGLCVQCSARRERVCISLALLVCVVGSSLS